MTEKTMPQLQTQMLPSVAATFYGLDGNGQEAMLTAAMQRVDPAVVRVHLHDGITEDSEVLVEYADRVVRYHGFAITEVVA